MNLNYLLLILKVLGFLWIIHSFIILAITASIKINSDEAYLFVIFGYFLFSLTLLCGIIFIRTSNLTKKLNHFKLIDKFIFNNNNLKINKQPINLSSFYNNNNKLLENYLKYRNKLSIGQFSLDSNRNLIYRR